MTKNQITEQLPLLFQIEKQVEFGEIEMGVLENGVPYLTGRGLERMCGVGHGPFHRLVTNWNTERTKPRGKKIDSLLSQSGYEEDSLFLRAELSGSEVLIFTEPVCMALLEYYAFDADQPREQARHAFRVLARTKFREFVYDKVGYNPEQTTLDTWRHFHDRVDLTMDAVPVGYFCVFREISSIIVPMIRSGVLINDKVVPDISVGLTWANYWDDNKLAAEHGSTTQFAHRYPDYYPQSSSNPQTANAYPDAALPEFRRWLREQYIANKLPKYLLNHAKKGTVQLPDAEKLILAIAAPEPETAE